MDEFIGSVKLFAGNYAPRGWAFCQGQLLSIAQYTALFAIMGTAYGGDGRTNFALPDLRGRVPVGTGQGHGLSSRVPGQKDGAERVTLTQSEMPTHGHAVEAVSSNGNSADPTGRLLGNTVGFDREYSNDSGNRVNMSADMIQMSGGNQPHNNMQPSLGMNYIVCLEGIFPSRS